MIFFSRFSVRPACCSALIALFLSGCASVPDDTEYTPPPSEEKHETPQASAIDPQTALKLSVSSSVLGTVPEGWQTWVIRRDKLRTDYTLASKSVAGKPQQVLHAVAKSAASGLWVPMSVVAADSPVISWSWRTDAMIEGADSSRPETEDSPTRLILAFDGDTGKLPLRDQLIAETARMILGREMPYATLIYTWDTKQATGTVIPNAHSSRIKKKVVETGAARTGKWLAYQRNYVQDYTEIFGEAPGKLIGVGVLTDTDNTRQEAQAWYGDIQLLGRQAALGELRGPTAID